MEGRAHKGFEPRANAAPEVARGAVGSRECSAWQTPAVLLAGVVVGLLQVHLTHSGAEGKPVEHFAGRVTALCAQYLQAVPDGARSERDGGVRDSKLL